MTKIAIIQRPPVLLDRGATITRAVQWVGEAAAACNQQQEPAFITLPGDNS